MSEKLFKYDVDYDEMEFIKELDLYLYYAYGLEKSVDTIYNKLARCNIKTYERLKNVYNGDYWNLYKIRGIGNRTCEILVDFIEFKESHKKEDECKFDDAGYKKTISENRILTLENEKLKKENKRLKEKMNNLKKEIIKVFEA